MQISRFRYPNQQPDHGKGGDDPQIARVFNMNADVEIAYRQDMRSTGLDAYGATDINLGRHRELTKYWSQSWR